MVDYWIVDGIGIFEQDICVCVRAGKNLHEPENSDRNRSRKQAEFDWTIEWIVLNVPHGEKIMTENGYKQLIALSEKCEEK